MARILGCNPALDFPNEIGIYNNVVEGYLMNGLFCCCLHQHLRLYSDSGVVLTCTEFACRWMTWNGHLGSVRMGVASLAVNLRQILCTSIGKVCRWEPQNCRDQRLRESWLFSGETGLVLLMISYLETATISVKNSVRSLVLRSCHVCIDIIYPSFLRFIHYWFVGVECLKNMDTWSLF